MINYSRGSKERKRAGWFDECDISVIQNYGHQSLETSPYNEIGAALSNHERVVRIREELKMARKNSDSGHFFLVNGPSGIGKTQLPYALRTADFPVLHLLMTIPDESDLVPPSQVDPHLLHASILLNFALESDVIWHQIRGEHFDPSLENSRQNDNKTPLLTVSFILFLLGGVPKVEDRLTLEDLRNYVSTIDKEKLPIIFLDDILPFDDECFPFRFKTKISRMLLVCKLLRAVGLVFVLMGTNLFVANELNDSRYIRSNNERSLWCRLITELPQSTPESRHVLKVDEAIHRIGNFSHHSALCNFFESQFSTCNPMFLVVFVDVISRMEKEDLELKSSCQLLDWICREMSIEIFHQKPALRAKDSLRGQLALHLDCFRHISYTCFVGSHFAKPGDGNRDIYLERNELWKGEVNGKRNRSSDRWNPSAYFPSATDDAFPYLLLAGGSSGSEKEFPPPFLMPIPKNEKKFTTMTTLQCWVYLRDQHNAATIRTAMNFGSGSNYVKNLNERESIEVVAGIGMEIASHYEGCAGMKSYQYLLYLCRELITVNTNLYWGMSEIEFRNFIGAEIADLMIPYLSSVNDVWPEALTKIKGTHFANLNRPADRVCLDLKVSNSLITGEVTHHPEAMQISTIWRILNRIPETSKIHFVFCSKLQKSYFRKYQSWSKKCERYNWHRLALGKIIIENNLMKIVPFTQHVPIPKNPGCLVVFFSFCALEEAIQYL